MTLRPAVLFFALATSVAAAPPPVFEPDEPDLAAVEQSAFDSTNALRETQNLPPLIPDKLLAATAKRFATYMARSGLYGHEADGKTPGRRLQSAGYQYCFVAENIAYAFNTRGYTTAALARTFVEGWKNSPGHRRNMVEPEATNLGVGIAHSPETGIYYAVQMYTRPLRGRTGRCR
jgi:uncharacterized protein YkwD